MKPLSRESRCLYRGIYKRLRASMAIRRVLVPNGRGEDRAAHAPPLEPVGCLPDDPQANDSRRDSDYDWESHISGDWYYRVYQEWR
jgi:hypothetical protein